MSKKANFFGGFLIGCLLFIVPIIFGYVGIVGSDTILKLFPTLGWWTIVLYLVLLSLVAFAVYSLIFQSKNIFSLSSYVCFSVGFIVSLLLFIGLGLWSVSKLEIL